MRCKRNILVLIFRGTNCIWKSLVSPRSSQTLNDRGCRNICLAMATGGPICLWIVSLGLMLWQILGLQLFSGEEDTYWHLWPWFIVGCFRFWLHSSPCSIYRAVCFLGGFTGLRRFKMPGMACQLNRSWFEWWKAVPWLTLQKLTNFRSWNEHLIKFQCQTAWDGAHDPHDPDVSCDFICPTWSLPQLWFCWTSSTFCWTQCYWWWVCRTLQVT